MAKQLNVNLQMTANTSQAKQQIAELDKLLTNLSVHASKSNSLGLGKELTKSVEKAAELKAILETYRVFFCFYVSITPLETKKLQA